MTAPTQCPMFYGFAIVRPDGEAISALFRTREAAISRAIAYGLGGGKFGRIDKANRSSDWAKLQSKGYSIQAVEIWTAPETHAWKAA